MFDFKELLIEKQPRYHWLVSLWLRVRRKPIVAYHLRDLTKVEPIGIVREEHWARRERWAQNSEVSPWLLRWYKHLCNPSRRSVVRRCDDNRVVLMLYHPAPVLAEMVRIYDTEDRLTGRCIGDPKTSLGAGFKLVHPDGKPLGSVSYSRTKVCTFSSDTAEAKIVREATDSGADGFSRVRYRVSETDGELDQGQGRFFLLAAAMAIIHADQGWPA
jgi:hypothetical protein